MSRNVKIDPVKTGRKEYHPESMSKHGARAMVKELKRLGWKAKVIKAILRL